MSLCCRMFVVATALWSVLAECGPSNAAAIDFRRDVAPILQRRCLRCHNDRDHRGGLSLQSAEATARGGESGDAVVPGDVDSSYLLDVVIPSDDGAEMPKGEPALSEDEVALLRRWIEGGASWPADVVLETPVLWSLKPLERPEISTNVGTSAHFPVRNAIDAFVARGHGTAELEAAPQADRRTLIRRLYLDIVGLLPTPAVVESFVADADPHAYERLVDGLLDSPHYGEQWGRHWLDLARYADSSGYLGDSMRPHVWVYREWVIDAINRDLPFDEFTIEQLAGDLLDNATLEQKVATGFHRNTLRNTEAGVDLELYRTKEIVDRVTTTGMVWLGLTLGCAECHEHKNDPISQREFYDLYSFFNNADEVSVLSNKPWEIAEHERALESWRPTWDGLMRDLQRYEMADLDDKQKAAIAKALAGEDKSATLESVVAFYRVQEAGWKELREKVEAHLKRKPVAPATRAPVFAERRKDRRETFVHIRGVYKRHGEKATPGTPAVLPDLKPRGAVPDRLDLARWLFEDANPLTARVAANRIWQHLFGRGIVATPNDFGYTGARPTHPLLLDWLASEYRRLGWSGKAMIRLIVTSSTYRLSSSSNAVASQQDAGNDSLWRQNSYRVTAETIRDVHLTASGLLDRTIGGRGIRPPLPAFVTEVGRSVKWPVSEGSERYRRGMYIIFKRTVPFPMLMTFDAPDASVSCSRRERSNTPLQALTLLNAPMFYECAQTLGKHLTEAHPEDVSAAIDELYMRCFSRPPVASEREYLTKAHADLLQLTKEGGEGATSPEAAQLAAMTAIARIVMNLDEFITRD